jgi:hypothetical protein
MADIFMSYAREDEARIESLIRALEDEGWSVFWDQRIPAGQTWRSYIGKALSDARCVVVAWSLHSIASSWVSEEAEEGKQRGILVPILLDAVEPPIGFRSIQAAALTDWQSKHRSPRFEQLLHDIREVLHATPTPLPTQRLAEREPDIFRQPHKSPQRDSIASSRRLIYGALMAVLLGLVIGGSYWMYGARFPAHTLPKRPAPPPEAEANIRSMHSDTPTRVSFSNMTGFPVQIHWLDFAGKRVLYRTLGPGESYVQQTFLTHPWLVTDANGQGIMLFMPEPGFGRALISKN